MLRSIVQSPVPPFSLISFTALPKMALQASTPSKLQPSLQLQAPYPSFPPTSFNLQSKITNLTLSSLQKPWYSLTYSNKNSDGFTIRGSLDLTTDIPPNALRRKQDPLWRGGFSLGVDLGLSHTGLALSKGFSFRPLTVLNLRGQKLELQLIQIAENEEVDEFIIGLPKSSDGKETPQSNIVRSVAGRLAVRAAQRGWRVYLLDEYGTSVEAMDRMINVGVNKAARHGKIDAYAAMMVLERYFSKSGEGTELVWPKQLELQEKIRKGPPEDDDFYPSFSQPI